jgi:hypothetical protein
MPVEPEVLAPRETRVRRPTARVREESTRQKEEQMAKAAKGKKRAKADSENQTPCKKRKVTVSLGIFYIQPILTQFFRCRSAYYVRGKNALLNQRCFVL